MMRSLFLLVLLLYVWGSSAQNLPSLVSGKNINSTFSIVGFDPLTREWGIAVATNNIYVGNSTIYIQPGLGAFSVIAETEPAYARNGFERLRQGADIREAIEFTRKKDPDATLRQVSGIDSLGNGYAFTGSSWKYQKGFAGSSIGKGFVVMGNQLSDSVLRNMSSAFERSEGTLARRLFAALVAGQKAGGQITGKQSAALVVKGANNEWYNNIDLRVDDSKDPFGDLQRLLNYHYGRIRLNQAVFALNMGDRQGGEKLLADAEKMIKGWNGLQSKLALAYLLLDQRSKAVAIIRAAMDQNPKWAANLPAFYVLKDQPGLKGLMDEKRFDEKDWISAADLTGQLNRSDQTFSLLHKALARFPRSSYLHYLFGKTLLAGKRHDEAKKELQQAVELDPSNQEAAALQFTLSD